MCLILFAYRLHPRYKLLLAANRDEFYARPTAPLAFWDDAPEVLAGRDLQAGGTWLGISRSGRFAAVTNYRDPRTVRSNAPSRGALVSDYLISGESAWEYLQALTAKAGDYNGFNLLLGDTRNLYYYSNYSNQNGSPQVLEPGLYGLSNHLLDTPWPKVQTGRQALAALLEGNKEPAWEALLNLLANRTRAADEDLPDTGVSLEWERVLSAMFIESPDYGTRSSTVLQVDSEHRVEIVEKTWADGQIRHFKMQWP